MSPFGSQGFASSSETGRHSARWEGEMPGRAARRRRAGTEGNPAHCDLRAGLLCLLPGTHPSSAFQGPAHRPHTPRSLPSPPLKENLNLRKLWQ